MADCALDQRRALTGMAVPAARRARRTRYLTVVARGVRQAIVGACPASNRSTGLAGAPRPRKCRQSGPERRKIPHVGAACGAVRLGLMAGEFPLAVVQRVEHGVADGRTAARQPCHACDLVVRGQVGEPVQPVAGRRDGVGGGRCCGGGGRGVPALREDGVHGHSARVVDGMVWGRRWCATLRRPA
jgi:hypothetical protein